jgi:hypothetical protein
LVAGSSASFQGHAPTFDREQADNYQFPQEVGMTTQRCNDRMQDLHVPGHLGPRLPTKVVVPVREGATGAGCTHSNAALFMQ